MPIFSSDPSASDILEAMRAEGSFLDITPADAQALFRVAHKAAVKRLRHSVLVRDLMTRRPVTLSADQEVREAAKLLAEAKVSGAPVTQGATLAGVVSVKDFLSLMGLPRDAPPMALAAALLDARYSSAAGLGSTSVGTIMSSPPITTSPDTPACEAAQLMARHGINRLPVTSGGRLEAIITSTDLVRAFGDMLGEAR